MNNMTGVNRRRLESNCVQVHDFGDGRSHVAQLLGSMDWQLFAILKSSRISMNGNVPGS